MPGYSNKRESDKPIARPDTTVVLRAPIRAMTVPAKKSADTVPAATASSTSESFASFSKYRALTDGMCVPHVPAAMPSTRN